MLKEEWEIDTVRLIDITVFCCTDHQNKVG